MKTNAILIYPKHSIPLICFEEFGRLLFYRSMKELPCFVFNPKTGITKYYTDASHIHFKRWKIILNSKPYFYATDQKDIPIKIEVPLILTKFKKQYEEK